MNDFAIWIAALAVSVTGVCAWLIHSLNQRIAAMVVDIDAMVVDSEDQWGLLQQFELRLAEAQLAVENMRATAGPIPPVLLHRTDWEQSEMNLELQPSESAAILNRQDAIEQVIQVYEDRLQRIEASRDQNRLECHIGAVAVKISRHLAERRSDFEKQALRRIGYCENSVETITRRFNEAELKAFAVKPARKVKPKKT